MGESSVGGRGGRVMFSLEREVQLTPADAWERLTDWAGHAKWVPMTRVEVDAGDPDTFVAFSGPGRLALEDRMRVKSKSFDSDTRVGACVVDKLGPVLVGEAEFTVRPADREGATVVGWREDVNVRHLPRVLAPVAATVGQLLFGWSLGRMTR